MTPTPAAMADYTGWITDVAGINFGSLGGVTITLGTVIIAALVIGLIAVPLIRRFMRSR